jgi:hypothetical protein
MGWIGCVRCEKFQRDYVRPIFHRSSCSNETDRNAPKNEFGVQWGGSGAFVGKFRRDLIIRTCTLIPQFDPFFTEFRAVTKRSNGGWIGCVHCEKFWRNFIPRTYALIHQFGLFCTDVRAVTKQSESPQNMSLGSNGVDRVPLLRKISTRLHFTNLCINCPSSTRFELKFMQ